MQNNNGSGICDPNKSRAQHHRNYYYYYWLSEDYEDEIINNRFVGQELFALQNQFI